jgi:hypothetical protein
MEMGTPRIVAFNAGHANFRSILIVSPAYFAAGDALCYIRILRVAKRKTERGSKQSGAKSGRIRARMRVQYSFDTPLDAAILGP